MKQRTDGDGSLHQRHEKDCERPKDGRARPTCKCKWRGVLVVGYKTSPKTGKPLAVRKYVTAATRSGAANKLRDLRESREAHTLPTRGTPTVQQWLNHWHGQILPRTGAKPRTLIGYRQVLDSYLIPLLGHIRLDRLTGEDIEAAYDILAATGNPTKTDERPLSAGTIHHAHTVLAAALRIAVIRKKIPYSPASREHMQAPTQPKHEPEPLDQAEWQAVLDAAGGVANPARWRVALAMGLRQGEALGLRWEDVDLEDGTIRVRQTLQRLPGRGLVFGTPKSDESRRTVAMPAQLVSELRTHRKRQAEQRLAAGDHWTDTGLVFTLDNGKPIDPRLDHERWTALLKRAGVRHYRLHSARHTAATAQLALGVDIAVVKANMGHSQLQTTLGYAKVVSELQRDAAKKVGDAMWGSA